ncbi:C-lysozyme inhibitor [Pantoea sp. Bo_2]|nr:C-lysozyme inhibitor [Pantoea sp. VH_3]KAA5954827.1 C-lysozyme inhibitor [Pantoea sp. VH_24]KAA5957025.1 C-lysozyme inhibitor [Pantoea sp. VH_25]KAA5958490.1 C-lysozyme inhibitor [Pantoea sp. VH_16]KAA5963989.1 C-lysozyme inhibitor [Pantoea sp. VH_18]KAA5982158.1 C-lysozyme inhibitor [Pantoea sp. M_3]KAA5997891.1 C-lysozyme inhibitor [Pantoea sp. M_1]KAA6000219.1 C-lysozyme inhibitor [Pantoea sp. F_7]KAA6008124.1 C-lysozyme inhibitor [Pantoea sp. F_18]KAA6009924.1 C-lysozyme inhibitor [
MNKALIVAVLAGMPMLVDAVTQTYLYDFIMNKQTSQAYHQLIAGHDFPAWVKQGGTSTPANTITIKGETWQLLSGCKPHNCPAQSIAILYSPEKGEIHGVYSDYDQKSERQTLTWLNLDPTDDAGMRKILFNRLNGDL